jgi:purine-nucleoside phosphorylase
MSGIQQPTPSLELSQRAVDYVQNRWPQAPRFAIILGTGAGELADTVEAEQILSYTEIPGFPRSTALGHKGQLVCGTLAGQPVVAMQGRFHLYEGYPFELATLPIHVLHQLGMEYLFVTNAAGGINPKFGSGQIMAISSHMDLMFRSSALFQRNFIQSRPRFRTDCYDPALIDRAIACGRRNGFAVHQGVYAAMLGPNFETRAEYRFLRAVGADAAGMSTVPEVSVAAHYGTRVLALSIIANVAKPDVLKATSGQEVINLAQVAGPQLQTIVVDAIEQLANQITG